MELISTQEVANLKGCSVRYVQKQVTNGFLESIKQLNDKNRPQYLIPLSALEPKIQAQYYEQKKAGTEVTGMPKSKAISEARPLDSFTADEREEIDFWVSTVERWQVFRANPKATNKAEIDKNFVLLMQCETPGITISRDILYRKWEAIRADNYAGLIDKRGQWRKGKSDVPDAILQVFNTFYLNEAQHPIKKCVEYTEYWAAKHAVNMLPLASYSTFRRKADEIPYPVKVLGRFGEKAYYDLCSPHIRREYESIASNEWWIADTHTFDIMTRGSNGKTHRIYINAFLDARSGIFTGWYVTANPSSDATLYALGQGIKEFGIPYNIYVDNGREYLTFDIGGRGHRAKKTLADGSVPFAPPGVFKRLGINMTNAIVRNARAKLIERRFRDVKDHISRLFLSYTGGSVAEKPDRLKHILKAAEAEFKGDKKRLSTIEREFLSDNTTIYCDKVVSDEQLIEMADKLIRGYMNYQAYGGSVSEDVGKRRIDVFWERLNGKQRKAEPVELSLLLMRSTRPQKVGRNGVVLSIAGKKIDFCNEELRSLQGEDVYLRYDPRNLNTVRVYTLKDQFVMEVPQANNILPYGATKELIAEGMKTIRKARRDTKEALRASTLPLGDEDSALALVLAYATDNLNNPATPISSKAIELVRVKEEPLLKAVGSTMDINRMVQNSEKHIKRNEEEKR